MVFNVSFAYVSGTFSNSDSQCYNPYFLPEYYYNDGTTDYKISENKISGSISEDGVVSLTIKTSDEEKTVTQSGSSISLPIKVKNVGNIKGSIASVGAILTFYDGTTEESVQNDCGIDDDGNMVYYIQLISSTFTITNNDTLSSASGNVEIASGSSVQIIDSLKINTGSNIAATTEDIVDSNLCGLNFVISFVAQLGQ